MARTTNARNQVIETAEKLFRSQGYTATGLTQILAESGAPKGSFYHHFPGGKEELASEVLNRYATRVENFMTGLGVTFAKNPEAFVSALFNAAGKEMASNHWIGCAAAIMVQEMPPHSQKLRRQLSEVYMSWTKAAALAIRPSCESDTAAEDLATLVVTSLTGARILARASHSLAPFHVAAKQIQAAAFRTKK